MRLSASIFAGALFAGVLSVDSATAQGFPNPRVPAGNPITTNKTLLGKALFWDEQLSSSGTIACGTCHMPENGGSDPRSAKGEGRHPGFDGRFNTADDVIGSPGIVARNADDSLRAVTNFLMQPQSTDRRGMTIINAAFDDDLFWDGRAGETFVDPADGQTVLLPQDAALESQAVMPILDEVEMGHIGRNWPQVVQRLKASVPLALASNIPTALRWPDNLAS